MLTKKRVKKDRSSLRKRSAPHLPAKLKKIHLSEEQSRMISEIKDYAVFLLDPKGNIQTWNLGAEKIKGYKPEEIIGKNFRIFYPPEEQKNKLPEKLLQKARKDGSATHEGWRVRKNGTKFWGFVTITALHDNNKKVIGYSKITRDLTERKIAENGLNSLAAALASKNKELQESNRVLEQANEELASFNFISSHDLQEPLRKIQFIVSKLIAQAGTITPDELVKNLERIQNSAYRMQQLIIDLITYAQINKKNIRFEPTDLNLILADVQSELGMEIKERHAIIEDHELCTLSAVPYQIRQLLYNLLSNALKFSSPDRAPLIVIRGVSVDGTSISGHRADKKQRYYELQISDNGIGIEPRYQEKIFELFQRLHTKEEFPGTGLGLAICKKIMENHKGFISANGTPGKGAVFTMYLPEEHDNSHD